MTEIKTREGGINSLVLRLAATAFMLAGLYGEKRGYSYDWIEAFGWTSFSIFAFLITEGVKNTSDKRLYIRRFAVFTLISELCYNFYYAGSYLNRYHQSVMCTLFLGLLIMLAVDLVRKKTDNMVVSGLLLVVLGYAAVFIAKKYHFAFSNFGIQTMLIFFVASRVKYTKFTQLVSLLYIALYFSTESVLTFSLGGLQYPLSTQSYSILALPFIWFYNGKRGPNSLKLRIALYMVYPVALLCFWFIRKAGVL